MVLIRPYASTDSIPEITSLLHRAYASLLAQGLRFVATSQDDATTLSRIEYGYCLIAEEEGRIVGTVTVYRSGLDHPCSYYRRPGLFYFGQFGVEPSAQGLGIGRRLLDEVERYVKSQYGIELALDTSDQATELIARYEKWGYRIVDTIDWPETNYVSVIMSKPL